MSETTVGRIFRILGISLMAISAYQVATGEGLWIPLANVVLAIILHLLAHVADVKGEKR